MATPNLFRFGVSLLSLFISFTSGTSAGSSNSTLTWTTCAAYPIPGLQCSNFTVPLDWSDPNGATITLGMTRLLARNQTNRLGSLIFNPGGPGEIASAQVAYTAMAETLGIQYFTFTAGVREHYDIIGLDPRGVGMSTPIRCSATIWNERVSLFPTNDAAFAALLAHNIALGESCRALTGPLAEHVDSASVARDMDAVRAALGDATLHLLALSYGNVIASAYAERFPERVGRVALDAVGDHSQSDVTMLFAATEAYEDELVRFAAWCEGTAECALYGRDVLALFDELVARAEESPLPAPGCSTTCRADVTADELILNAQGFLTFKERNDTYGIVGWNGLALALAAAEAGNATALSTTLAQDDASALFPSLAVGCLDWVSHAKSAVDFRYRDLLGRETGPHVRGRTNTAALQAGCVGWPLPAQNPQHTLVVSPDVPTILLVNAAHDPDSAYVWAHGLREQLPNSVLLTRDGDGHTSYIVSGPAADAIDHFLVTGEVPGDAVVIE